MSTIFFCSHQESKYNTEKWRHIFSQWYNAGTSFIGQSKGVYGLEEFISIGDLNNFVIGKKFSTREKWMMYMKALIFAKNEYRNPNLQMAEEIMNIDDPKTIRALGRKITGYDEKIWNDCKYEIVVNGNYLQFSQNKEMKEILLATGNREIVEAAYYDCVWGCGFSESDAETNRVNWGSNLLGKALEEVRRILNK